MVSADAARPGASGASGGGARGDRRDAGTQGRLVTFEGIDGCGKSTQLQLCADWLRAARPGREVLVEREPGGTPCGEAVRALLLRGTPVTPTAEMLLFTAARAELYARVVLPALARGECVLLDRSHYSTAAYQGAGLGQDQAQILALARLATGGRFPDRVLLFDVPVATARARCAGRRAEDLVERRGIDYFERVAEGYRKLARAEPERFAVIDARPEPAVVFRAVQEALADVG